VPRHAITSHGQLAAKWFQCGQSTCRCSAGPALSHRALPKRLACAALADDIGRQLYDLAKWGPTAANSTPARFVFVRSAPAKERLKPHLSAGNVAKVMTAPCCVIVAYDSRFYDMLPKLFPSRTCAPRSSE